ncbi:serine hydrolase domain-containing protein [Pedobacter sp. AW1-32]|uniref:serine hydrolase domain-containing protein n=1 Tax=Pedobacter sp. AW1-32 TaxID=3383026 RepID=UPI003FEFBA78
MPKKIKSILLTLLIALSFESFGQNASVDRDLTEIMQKYSAVGAAIAVVREGKVVYQKSYGYKDLDKKISLMNSDIFRIASISKSFSATSIMQLVEAGKLSLNDDFSKLVGFKIRNPNFPNQVITLKMLLSHTSSLNDSQGYFNLDAVNPDRNSDWAKCYNNYQPGTKYEYCNLNFNLIGAVIEKFSGERFDQYVKKHILSPLDLYAGYCVDSLDSTKFVKLYEYNAADRSFAEAKAAYAPRREELKNYVLGYSTPVFSPTGGMKISATDLARYMIMHMNYGEVDGKRIISKKHAKLMQTKITDDEGYGLALRSVDDLIAGVNLKGHNGSAYGLYSTMFFNPKEKYGFVVITNGCNPTYTGGYCDFSREAVNALYKRFIVEK